MDSAAICDKKIALITGGTQGIGKGITLKFLQGGYRAVICSRTPPKEPLFSDFIGHYTYIQCDISSPTSRTQLITKMIAKFGRIDVLVNNAGVAPKERNDLLSASEESFEYVMKINLQGPYFLTQAVSNEFLQLMKSGSVPDYSPSIITISSISAFTSSPSRGEYCISKAGLSMMTKLYADRLSEYGIPVYEIQPGIINTPMIKGVKTKYDRLIDEGLLPMKRWGQPEDIAEAAFALAAGNIPYATGQVLHIDGGFHLRRL